MTVRIVPTVDEHLPGLHATLDAVARERRYIGLTAAFPPTQTAAFVRQILESGGVLVVAVTSATEVVGWCDVERLHLEGFRHVGRLGMGVLQAYRRQGIGRRLAMAAITAARTAGIERIELEVFASNAGAIRLYDRLGFEHEGVKRQARKLDGRYDDIVLMALLGEPRS
ncbi:MAG TPA: GNAT family protein [Gemmatimonadales bacterium]|jgi:RimJ/RimL family protein N-acetyltransferase